MRRGLWLDRRGSPTPMPMPIIWPPHSRLTQRDEGQKAKPDGELLQWKIDTGVNGSKKNAYQRRVTEPEPGAARCNHEHKQKKRNPSLGCPFGPVVMRMIDPGSRVEDSKGRVHLRPRPQAEAVHRPFPNHSDGSLEKLGAAGERRFFLKAGQQNVPADDGAGDQETGDQAEANQAPV